VISNTPGILAAIQAAHIHTSTTWGRAIEFLEQAAHAVQEGKRQNVKGRTQADMRAWPFCLLPFAFCLSHAVSAVAGAGPPLSTEIHFCTAAPRMITASTIITTVQIVSTQPSMLRAALAPTASG
jgi:hypothetical protein